MWPASQIDGAEGLSPAPATPHVVVIDDNVAFRAMFQGLNEISNYPRFRFTSSPTEALAWVGQGLADVVITDIHMPEMDGVELTRRIIAIDPLLPVIALTGMARDLDVERACLEAGARYFLGKPVRQQQLISAVMAVHRHACYVRSQRDSLHLEREAKQALAHSEQRFRDVAGCIADWIWETDAALRFSYVSEGVQKVLGYAPDEVLGQPLTQFVVSRKDNGTNDVLSRYIDLRLPLKDILIWSVRRDGKPVCTLRSGVPLLDGDGGFLGYRGVDRDVTEKIRQDESLRSLVREREMFFQASEHSTHAVVITDPEARILYVNRAFSELYGYDRNEVIGQTPRILNPGKEVYRDLGYSETDYEALFRGMWAAIANPEIGHWEGELPNQDREGRIIWVHLIISGIRNVKGELFAYMGMPINITERRELERRVRVECYRALAELAEKRDNETGEHLKRMSAYVRLFGELLHHPAKQIDDMEIFAPLHDIGKVGISDSILLAPRRLTDEEFTVMKTHVTIGHDILAGRPTLEVAAQMTRHHHERWDGKGYPDGLSGAGIPECARILSICDVYDALRSVRPYKTAWTHEAAADLILNGAGTQFDPELVGLFRLHQHRFREIYDTHADTVT